MNLRRPLGRSAFHAAALAAAVLLCTPWAPAQSSARSAALAPSDAEARVVNYIREHLKPGQPLLVTELYNKVFTKPAERRALDKLYKAFFRIPLFVAEYQDSIGTPPTLKVIAQQFDLPVPGEADVLLRVMDSDPRVPKFLVRDPHTGELTRVDVEKIRSDPQFGQVIAHQLGGWEGQPAPAFRLEGMDGATVDSAALRGKLALLYVWFTGCPPCMKEAPMLVTLQRDFAGKLNIVGANADQLLALGYDDSVRKRYIQQEKINFPVVRWTRDSDNAYGQIAIFPAMFLIDARGVIRQHWVGFIAEPEIRRAIVEALRKQ